MENSKAALLHQPEELARKTDGIRPSIEHSSFQWQTWDMSTSDEWNQTAAELWEMKPADVLIKQVDVQQNPSSRRSALSSHPPTKPSQEYIEPNLLRKDGYRRENDGAYLSPPSHKGPNVLLAGGFLNAWQKIGPDSKGKNLSVALCRKFIDKWVLVHKARWGSSAHMDVAFATWITCLTGKTNFRLRNPTVENPTTWEIFDVTDDHGGFCQAWARVDLESGGIL